MAAGELAESPGARHEIFMERPDGPPRSGPDRRFLAAGARRRSGDLDDRATG